MEKIKIKLNRLIKIIKKNPKESWFLIFTLILGSFLRLYRIAEYMTYLGDEGRDMIIVRRFLVDLHPPLIGPGTSVGNMYLGPIYYYMMALPTLLSNFSPVGPAVMVALLGVLTIFLLWWVGREWFGKKTALLISFLYALSPTIIIFSKASWNPNIMPFFSLLCIYSIWKVWKKKNYKWLPVLGISYAFVLQSHYFGLFLLPIFLVFWFLSKSPKKYTIWSIVLFLLLMSPLLVFDIRHNWLNLSAMKSFLGEGEGSFGGVAFGIKNFLKTSNLLVTRTLGARNEVLGILATTTIFLGSVFLYLKKKANAVLLSWFLIGAFGLSLYKSEVYDHYMGFLFPVSFLLFGSIVSFILKKKNRLLTVSVYIFSAFLIIFSIKNSPLSSSPNRQLQRNIETSSLIEKEASGERLNLASITRNSNRDPYVYLLLKSGVEVVDIDPNAVAYTVTDQLFVVCELPKEECNPMDDPSVWITSFGPSQINGQWEVGGVNVYKLVHKK